MLHITLPDGSKRDFPGPVTVAEVAASIGTGLAKAALQVRLTAIAYNLRRSWRLIAALPA